MNITMSGWWIVFTKEVRENLRDRRAIVSSLVMGAVFGPLLFAGMFTFLIKQETAKATKTLSIPVIGAEHAPSLVDWLRRQGAEIVEAPVDAEAAVRQRDVELVVEIPPEYAQQWSEGQPAEVQLLHDSSRRDSNTSVARARNLLEAWGQQVGSLRVRLRGINPEIGRAVRVLEQDISTPESRSGRILAMWPYLLILAVFMGGMYLAIDVTAGERERQSMEPLLLNPVSTSEVVAGKMLAIMTFSLLALVLSMVMFRYSFAHIPVAELGIHIDVSWILLLKIFLLMLPIALFSAAAQTLVSAFSKGFREAQTYLSFLLFIPMLPGLWLALSPLKPDLWLMSLPILNQGMLIQMLGRDESVPWSWHLLAWVSTAVLGILAAWLARRCYARPGIIGA